MNSILTSMVKITNQIIMIINHIITININHYEQYINQYG